MGTYHLGFTHMFSQTSWLLIFYKVCITEVVLFIWSLTECMCEHVNVHTREMYKLPAYALSMLRGKGRWHFSTCYLQLRKDWVHFSNTAAKENFLLVACFRLSWMHFHFIDFWSLIFFLPSFISYLYACNDNCGQSKALKEQTFKTLASKVDCD